ncbi:MAG: hypothetical protein WBA17_17985 [Saprospiraceae bacterium]
MIIYGSRATRINEFGVSGTKCPYCNTVAVQHVGIYGKYGYLYWIPFISMGKVMVAECTQCKKTYEQKEFSDHLRQRLAENKQLHKAPLWHWSGLAIVSLLILFISISGSINADKDPRYQQLKADMGRMTEKPAQQTDSVGFAVANIMKMLTDDPEIESNFTFHTTVAGDKLLFLAKLHGMEDLDDENRFAILTIIDDQIDEVESLKNLARYIGIEGSTNFEMVRTPKAFDYPNQNERSALYKFYGPTVNDEE